MVGCICANARSNTTKSTITKPERIYKEDPTYNNYAWESMEDNWDEESSQHYKESRQPGRSNHPEMRRRTTRITNWRRFRTERLNRRQSTDRGHPKPWNITHESRKKIVKFQEGAWN